MFKFLLTTILLFSAPVLANTCQMLFTTGSFNTTLKESSIHWIGDAKYRLSYVGERVQKVVKTPTHMAAISKRIRDGREFYEVDIFLNMGRLHLIKSIPFSEKDGLPLVLWMKKNRLLIGTSNGRIMGYSVNFKRLEPSSVLPILAGDKESSVNGQVVLFLENIVPEMPGISAIHYNGNISYIPD